MPFTQHEKDKLLATPYVGGKVIERLEAIGIDSFGQLKVADVSSITAMIADMLQTTCWKNSPQAKRAIQNAIKTAQS